MSFNSARSAPALEAALAEEHCEQKSQIDPEAQFRERLRIQELLRLACCALIPSSANRALGTSHLTTMVLVPGKRKQDSRLIRL